MSVSVSSYHTTSADRRDASAQWQVDQDREEQGLVAADLPS